MCRRRVGCAMTVGRIARGNAAARAAVRENVTTSTRSTAAIMEIKRHVITMKPAAVRNAAIALTLLRQKIGRILPLPVLVGVLQIVRRTNGATLYTIAVETGFCFRAILHPANINTGVMVVAWGNVLICVG